MKKILTIVLAIAMILSLSTALAATWGNNDANTATASAVTISVAKYIVLEDAAGTSYYSQLDDAAIVKANDQVAFQVKLGVPSVGSLNNQFGTTVFTAGDTLQVKIDGTNLKNAGDDLAFTAMITLTSSAQTIYLTKAEGALNTAAATSTDAGMYLDMAKAYGAVDLKINVKFMSELADIAIKSGDDKFYVAASGDNYVVTSTDYRAAASVEFVINSSDKVTGIIVTIDGTAMTVAKTDGVYQCTQGSATAAQKFAGDDFLNKVLSVLGFSAYDALYSGTVYMDDINWAQNFGVYFNNSNNATYAPYTPVPVTVPAATIPKTGSNASVIGFAMVALAVVVAAVVAVRKVRA